MAVALALAAGCSSDDAAGFAGNKGAAQAAEGKKVRVIEPGSRELAPAVTGTTLEDKPFNLDEYRGKVVVLNFWASWCGPCRSEIPVLKEVAAETRDQGVRLVGVNSMDGKSNAQAFVRNFDIEYPSIYDQAGRVALAFRDTIPPQNLPSTIIIDRQGRVAARIIGETTYTQLKPVVKRVAERP